MLRGKSGGSRGEYISEQEEYTGNVASWTLFKSASSITRQFERTLETMAPMIDPPQTVEWQGKQVPVWPMPTVDYALLLSQDPAEVQKVLNACLEEGYFYLDLQVYHMT